MAASRVDFTEVAMGIFFLHVLYALAILETAQRYKSREGDEENNAYPDENIDHDNTSSTHIIPENGKAFHPIHVLPLDKSTHERKRSIDWLKRLVISRLRFHHELPHNKEATIQSSSVSSIHAA